MKKTIICSLAVLLACSPLACAADLTIADFGGKADGVTDNGPAFRKAFVFAAGHPGTTLRLGGVCRVKTAESAALHVMSRKMGAHGGYVAFGEGIKGLTIENGEVLLDGGFAAFSFMQCPGLIFRNVTFDYDPPILSQGSIVATDRAHGLMTVVPDKGYPSPGDKAFADPGSTWLMPFLPGGEPAFFFVGHVKSVISDSEGREVLAYDRPDMAAALQGKKGLRYVRMQREYGSLLVFQFCDGLRIEDCSIYATSAFAALFLFCNDTVLTGNRICPRPGGGHIVSTCADGFHFIGARRGPLIENNLFDRLVDDNIVISLRGNRITSWHGSQLQLAPSSCTWYEPGDTIEVVTLDDGQRREYKITGMAPQANLYAPPLLTLDRPLEGNIVTLAQGGETALPTLVFNRSWRLDGTLIRHNKFRNTRRYAVFMGAGGVRIEDNEMSGFTSSAILCSYYDMLKGGPGRTYYPYYFTDGLIIRNNVISGAFHYGEGGSHPKESEHAMGAIEMYGGNGNDRKSAGVGNLQLARNIVIENNTIRDSGAEGIHLANGSNITITGNTVLNPNLFRLPSRHGIWVEAASDVKIDNNRVEGTLLNKPVQTGP